MLEVRGVKPPRTFLVRVGSKRVKSHTFAVEDSKGLLHMHACALSLSLSHKCTRAHSLCISCLILSPYMHTFWLEVVEINH